MKRAASALLLAWALLLLPACSAGPRSENVLLISLDATRADHVDSGRGGRAWTPNLRRFAAGAWVFENAYSPIPQTLPAHLGLLSGRLPHELGVYGNEHVYDGRRPTLQQVLRRRGWRTAAVVSLGTLDRATGFARGFDRFEDRLHDQTRFYADAEKVTTTARAQLESLQDGKFFLFVHYSDPHTPYAPPQAQGRMTILLDGQPLSAFNAYSGTIARIRVPLAAGRHRLQFRLEAPSQDFDFFIIRRLEARNGAIGETKNLEFTREQYGGSHLLRGREGSAVIHCRSAGELRLFQVIPILTARATAEFYRREVEYLDSQVGRLLNALQRLPAARNTAVVITADHGEGLGERESYTGHARFLNRQFIHVPLLARFPGESPRRIAAAVSLLSVPSWLQAALGIDDSPIPPFGPPWSALRRGRLEPEVVPSFTFAPASVLDRCSLISWPYQLIVNRHPQTGAEEREHYDLRLACERRLAALPGEVALRQAPETWRRLAAFSPMWRAAFSRNGRAPSRADQRRIEELKTLGYLNQP